MSYYHHYGLILRAFVIVEMLLIVILASHTWQARAVIDCPTVTQLLNTCSSFISFGTPDPLPGSPCCDALVGLNNLGDSTENRQSICRCVMGLIAAYDPNAAAIGTLPGFCGISLGFTIEPNVDCSMVA